MLDAFLGLFSRDIGIDLGTANTLVHVRDRGIVISEPSVVAIDAKTKQVLAIGAEAKRMVGRTPANIIAVRPLRDGVISDFDVTEQMIKYFVHKVHDRVGLIPRPRMLLGIPSGVTEVEKRAVRDAALNAGARWARLIEEPMAAAIGAGPARQRAVRAASSSTSAAARPRWPSSASAASSSAAASASAATRWTRTSSPTPAASTTCCSASAPRRTSRSPIGSAYPGDWDEQRVTLRGRDLLTGLPRAVEVGADQIREAIEPSVAADRGHDQGHHRGDAAGAGGRHHGPGHRPGRRRGAARRASTGAIAEATQMPVHVADDPLTCVARGTGMVLEELDSMSRTLVAETYARPPR